MDPDELATIARTGWGAVADRYVEEIYDELDRKPFDRELYARFATLVEPGRPVLELGCGPGHITAHLASLGLDARGIDLTPEMIERARALNPTLRFDVGDMRLLDEAPMSLAGAVAPYSIINLVREDVPGVLARVAGALVDGGPLMVSAHRGSGSIREEQVLGRDVPMVATLFELDELTDWVRDADFEIELATVRQSYPDEYPSERVYVLARRSAR